MVVGHKERSRLVYQGATKRRFLHPLSSWTTSKTTIMEFDEVDSVNHHWPPRSGSRTDVGGNFLSVKRYYKQDVPEVHAVNPALDASAGEIVGVILPKYQSVTTKLFYPSPVLVTNNELVSLGTTAISRVLPTNPAFDASTALGELFGDGIPHAVGSSLFRDRVALARQAGDEYLNVEFGWKPLLSDLRKFAHAVKKSHKILKQYKRDSDKLIRRRYQFPDEISTSLTTSPQNTGVPALNTLDWRGSGTLTTVTKVTKKRWFSGAFCYHLQGVDDALEKVERHVQLANHLLGIVPTPETLWNLAPWSWAADWVSNTGDVIHNFSRFTQDGLVMSWGYMMANTITQTTYTLTGISLRGGPVINCSQTFTTDVKQRIRATPFGFGLNISGFTTRQWAILGALGLSHSPGQLARA